jgi:uncharacterized protein YoxC
MNEWAVVFLGVIAAAMVVQCVFVVLAARSVRTSGERVNELCQQFETDIKPTLEDIRQGAANLRAISDSGREQAERIEALLSTTLGNIETAVEGARLLIMKPLASLSDLSAFWGGVRQGLESYWNEAPKRRSPPVPGRRSEDSDEHMFIG